MTGVQRGAVVKFSEFRTATGQPDACAPVTGLVLDRTDVAGEWWVSIPGERDAVRVKARNMSPARPMHGASR